MCHNTKKFDFVIHLFRVKPLACGGGSQKTRQQSGTGKANCSHGSWNYGKVDASTLLLLKIERRESSPLQTPHSRMGLEQIIDVTPASQIRGIITEKGVIKKDYGRNAFDIAGFVP
ncbi:unnamed protein product [Cuscuta campestris]|uniref:Uncharacterized protein n=1 Tax=Cuscuta campestris TaxID=132261 RepID=A0A484KNE5_9ASTE|nr:unnamed protein product [Cuscuta campestris]